MSRCPSNSCSSYCLQTTLARRLLGPYMLCRWVLLGHLVRSTPITGVIGPRGLRCKGRTVTWSRCQGEMAPDCQGGKTCVRTPLFQTALSIILLLFLFFLFIFRERGREGEREGEKYQCMVVSCMPLTGDRACNPGMCPD